MASSSKQNHKKANKKGGEITGTHRVLACCISASRVFTDSLKEDICGCCFCHIFQPFSWRFWGERQTKVGNEDDEKEWAFFSVGFRFSLVGEEIWRSLDLEELTEEILKSRRERERDREGACLVMKHLAPPRKERDAFSFSMRPSHLALYFLSPVIFTYLLHLLITEIKNKICLFSSLTPLHKFFYIVPTYFKIIIH